jgi:hypothetical protein
MILDFVLMKRRGRINWVRDCRGDIILDDAREANGSPGGPEDNVPPYAPGPAVTQPGDLWVLGQHRLLCGDARDKAAYDVLLEGAKAEFVFTDPPYNVRIDGHVCGLGRIRHGDFAMGCGEMSEAEFAAFLESVFQLLAANTVDGSIHDVCMDWRHMSEMLTAARKVYSELKNLCVWNKTNAGMGSFYRSKHELVFVWKNGSAPHINTFELGQHGRSRSNVWDYAGINTMRPGRLEELAMHPTIKPVGLVADAIKDCSRRGAAWCSIPSAAAERCCSQPNALAARPARSRSIRATSMSRYGAGRPTPRGDRKGTRCSGRGSLVTVPQALKAPFSGR